MRNWCETQVRPQIFHSIAVWSWSIGHHRNFERNAFNSELEETFEVILPDISRESETVIFAFVLSRRLAIVMLKNEMT